MNDSCAGLERLTNLPHFSQLLSAQVQDLRLPSRALTSIQIYCSWICCCSIRSSRSLGANPCQLLSPATTSLFCPLARLLTQRLTEYLHIYLLLVSSPLVGTKTNSICASIVSSKFPAVLSVEGSPHHLLFSCPS